jgi:hypothetical protein
MKKLFSRFIKVCPKTGKFKGFKPLTGFYRLLLPVVGFFALVWILFRVITKPSRINYPCVKTAMPFAAGFISYFIMLGVSLLAFLRTKKKIFLSPYLLISMLTICGFSSSFYLLDSANKISLPASIHDANTPLGVAQGIFPGRVVWVYNADATNENCSPKTYNHEWFRPENTDQTIVDNMVSNAIRSLTGNTKDDEAWEAIFKYHNSSMGKGTVGYKAGEKIFIKINATSAWSGNFNTNDLTPNRYSTYYAVSETSPPVVLAILRQLVNVVGVAESDIYIGDPMKHIYKHSYDLWHEEFPNVHYLDNTGYTNLGREKVDANSSAVIQYSDQGKVLRANAWDPARPGNEGSITGDYLYKIFQDAEYLINIPQLKGHKRAGMTMFAKNNFGSHTRSDAAHLHNGLIAPLEMENGILRPGYGLYRVLVDLMGSKYLGKKNLFYLCDALWATDYELDIPLKWKMPPFNDDYMSSVFASLDPVAIESVGYDFLRAEFTAERGAGTYVQMDGVDDFLHQAADSTTWPSGIKYDPDGTGVHVASLGVHEHWDNSSDMKYSKNLGTGQGIELFKADALVSVRGKEIANRFELYQNYPNPFNPSTTIRFNLVRSGSVRLNVYDITGKLVDRIIDGESKTAGDYELHYNAGKLSSGVYFYKLICGNVEQTKKFILLK